MLLGCIADDFTGAGDLANTLARGGMHTRLFVGLPPNAQVFDCEGAVIALKSRSIPAAEAVAQSLAALDRLQAAGSRQILFKYCSTFDSTSEGNIGPVAEALAGRLGVRGVVVCPAFPATGRTVYQGHLFVGDRLLSESGMERHPLTPMTDPDLRRWLSTQTRSVPGHIPLSVVRRGADAVARALAESDTILTVVDATSDEDLRTIGQALSDATLITGGSGIALGLPDNFRDQGLLGRSSPGFVTRSGPAIILAGSCSTATRAQVARHAARFPALAIDVARLIAGEDVAGEVEAFIASRLGEMPLVYSTAEPELVSAGQQRHGAARSAEAVEALFGELARRSLVLGAERLVVAGGETSGAVVTALGLDALEVGPEIEPGVPALSATSAGRPLALALKSGNFGGPDFLAKAVARLGGEGE